MLPSGGRTDLNEARVVHGGKPRDTAAMPRRSGTLRFGALGARVAPGPSPSYPF